MVLYHVGHCLYYWFSTQGRRNTWRQRLPKGKIKQLKQGGKIWREQRENSWSSGYNLFPVRTKLRSNVKIAIIIRWRLKFHTKIRAYLIMICCKNEICRRTVKEGIVKRTKSVQNSPLKNMINSLHFCLYFYTFRAYNYDLGYIMLVILPVLLSLFFHIFHL